MHLSPSLVTLWRHSLAALALLAMIACGGSNPSSGHQLAAGGDSGGFGGSVAGGGAGGGGGLLVSCPSELTISVDTAVLHTGIEAPLKASGDLEHIDEINWEVPSGNLMPTVGPAVAWTVGDHEPHVPSTHTLKAIARTDGCPDVVAEISVTLDWPERRRVLVLYNPAADGSQQVAQHYATQRGIPSEQLCASATTQTLTLQSDELAPWLKPVTDCLDTLGARIHYIVPVFGVPYMVNERIFNLPKNSNYKVQTSLDALLVYGKAALTISYITNNPLYRTGFSMNAQYEPYVPFGQLRKELNASYYLVTRIDGVSASAAMALIDRTMVAQGLANEGKLAGMVYVDARWNPAPSSDKFGSYESGDWNMYQTKSIFETFGKHPVVFDNHEAEFGQSPAPLSCPDALYYAGWYSVHDYQNVFNWQPGAIGAHLDSFSADDIRGGSSWSARALSEGITATFGAVNEPYVAGMPEYDQFFLYLTQGASYGEAAYESTRLGAWMVLWVGDPLYRPYGQQSGP